MGEWTVKLVCCGRDDGEYIAKSWEEASSFRESYTSGEAVNEQGYSATEHSPGHKRAGIITKTAHPKPTKRIEEDKK